MIFDNFPITFSFYKKYKKNYNKNKIDFSGNVQAQNATITYKIFSLTDKNTGRFSLC